MANSKNPRFKTYGPGGMDVPDDEPEISSKSSEGSIESVNNNEENVIEGYENEIEGYPQEEGKVPQEGVPENNLPVGERNMNLEGQQSISQNENKNSQASQNQSLQPSQLRKISEKILQPPAQPSIFRNEIKNSQHIQNQASQQQISSIASDNKNEPVSFKRVCIFSPNLTNGANLASLYATGLPLDRYRDIENNYIKTTDSNVCLRMYAVGYEEPYFLFNKHTRSLDVAILLVDASKEPPTDRFIDRAFDATTVVLACYNLDKLSSKEVKDFARRMATLGEQVKQVNSIWFIDIVRKTNINEMFNYIAHVEKNARLEEIIRNAKDQIQSSVNNFTSVSKENDKNSAINFLASEARNCDSVQKLLKVIDKLKFEMAPKTGFFSFFGSKPKILDKDNISKIFDKTHPIYNIVKPPKNCMNLPEFKYEEEVKNIPNNFPNRP